jgi:hypothetical protein
MKMNKAAAEHYIWGDQCDGWILEQSADRAMIHERMPAGTVEGEMVTLNPMRG